MSAAQHEIEHIVHEVLRRLREPEKTPGKEAPGAILRIGHKLITLATLEGNLAGVRQLVARPDAIVTPAVRDELRKRNITLTTAEQSSKSPVLLLATAYKYSPAALIAQLAKGGLQIEEVTFADWKQAVRKMIDQLANSSLMGVLLTDRPAAAACLANRDKTIRAAVATDATSAMAAVETMGANLLTVDPAAHSLHTLERLVREYAQQGRVTCPDEFQGM